MKTIKYLILAGALVTATGCQDFLEEEPRSLVPTEAFYNTVPEATKALVGTYSYLSTMYNGIGIGLVSDMAADVFMESIAGGGGSTANFFNNFRINPDNDILATQFRNHYTLINSANTLIFNLQTRDLKDEVKENILAGEAKFLRALAYFNLVRIFGNVPLRTEPATSTEGLYIGRSPEAQVYAQIIADLTDAGKVLNEKSEAPGRANKLAANALLAKVYLSQKDYTKALAALQPVLGKRSLFPDFADNFKVANENNTVESIFEVQYGLRPTNSNIIEFVTVPGTPGVKGNTYAIYMAEEDQINSYATGDTRKDKTFWNKSGSKNFGGFFLRKYNDALSQGAQTADAGQINYPILRYADVLLMQAEALNGQNNGPTLEAYEAVNKVRRRAFGLPINVVSAQDLMPGLSKEAFLEAVLEERRREFAGEGQRWFDLKRNGKLFEKLGSKGFVQGKHEVWPIPRGAIDANNQLEQTEAYK